MSSHVDERIRAFLADEARRVTASAPSLDEAVASLAPRIERRPTRGSRGLVVLFAAALLVVALSATVALGSGLLRLPPDSDVPVRVIEEFGRPFEYVLPMNSDLEVRSASWRIVEFTAGDRGVTVADVTKAATESGLGLPDVRLRFPSFFEDLERNQGLAVAGVTDTTLDGHPALQGDIHTEEPIAYRHIHLAGREGAAFIELFPPERLIVADVDGVVVMIRIWTTDKADLAGWESVAMELVNSIRFVENR